MSEADESVWNVHLREGNDDLEPSHLRQPPSWIEFMREIDGQWQRYMRELDSPEQRLRTKVHQRFSFDR